MPHPSKASSAGWKKAIPAKEPVGLLIQSVRRTGLTIDKQNLVWQCKEQPVDLAHVPYQYLAKLVVQIGVRARNAAAKNTKAFKMALKEVDAVATRAASRKLSMEDKALLQTVQAGGGYDKAALAAINSEYSTTCDYCGGDDASLEFLIWHCNFFQQQRMEADSGVARVPTRLLHPAIMRGVAPAMQCMWTKTFWVRDVDSDDEEETCKVIGARIDAPETVKPTLEKAARRAMNVRQRIAEVHGPFSRGVMPLFLAEVEGEVPRDINVYGDGSLQCPGNAWFAIGGYGVWWPEQVLDQAFLDTLPELVNNYAEANDRGVGQWNCMRGQAASSTRMELAA